MKKIILILLAALVGLTTKGQDTLAHHADITLGVMLTGGVSYAPKDKSTALFYTVAPSFNMVLNKSHHHVMYDVLSCSAQTLNGIFIGKNYDIYHFFQQSVKNSDRYTSVGVEKFIPIEKIPVLKKIKCLDGLIAFGEIGTNFRGILTASVGVTLHPQIKL